MSPTVLSVLGVMNIRYQQRLLSRPKRAWLLHLSGHFKGIQAGGTLG